MKTTITILAILVCGFGAQAQTEKINKEVLKLLVSNAGQIVLVEGDTGLRLSEDQQLASLVASVLSSDVSALNTKEATSIGAMSAYCSKTKVKTEYLCSAGFNFRDLVIKNNSLINTDYSESSLVLTFEVVLKNNKPELKSKIIKTYIAG